ncbi:unnamed protein product [Zymoseptoria tritici ST99CH_1A5]|uniref:Uncharacterized protein n=1 Tax=Zymoseptoria tritici ST99CH_1A5 TaxID=1276529 RepID=A0A1Y6M470_ZYMTR|nr:unnamed protein product [Zymoseptoria tritici ST99CH_3D1]SMY30568.1 unnamed protein product [Zymoseptoria tritici ST99CH_1A5]
MYDPPRIEVTASGYRRSPLLNTCKEVRADALKLFYSINSFNVQALQFDYSAMAKFANGLVAICTRSQLGGISFEVRNQLDAQRKENHAARHRAIYRAVAHIIKVSQEQCAATPAEPEPAPVPLAHLGYMDAEMQAAAGTAQIPDPANLHTPPPSHPPSRLPSLYHFRHPQP